MKKAYIQTYGCQMNEHDTHRMMGVLVAEGYALTNEPKEASLIIVNTCSVRQNPENKVYSFLGRLRKLKQENPELIVAVGGCVAQQEGEAILRREKTVDMVFGPDNMFRLPEMIAAVQGGERVLRTKWQKHDRRVQNFIPEKWVEEGYVEGCKAYLSITKGCDNFCTFCVVPYTRGREVSRERENILREARDLIEKGAKEIWLLGQNVNSYRAGGDDFHSLLDAISRLPGLVRLRFTSPHPNAWNNALSDLMAGRPVICNQLHLPFQAGSDRILEMMRRGHTIEQYLEKVRYLREVIPALELSTDLIVGFPTETEDDFLRTLEVVEEGRFNQIYAFKYSSRPRTKAAEMDDGVPREIKEERLRRVLELQDTIRAEKMAAYVGTTETVLIDGAHTRTKNKMNGRTGGYLPVSIETSELEIGEIVEARITGFSGHWLDGEVWRRGTVHALEDSLGTVPMVNSGQRGV